MEYTNALIHETSPYLLQHAHNPVHWYPWGEKAFQKAKDEEKPIFLSIGYSTCHWCHVMEQESFEDPQVAAFLNEHFISIKVDKEERPDIDSVYMGVCQALTGSGGWPMTIFMTPQQNPFYAGTYFPKHRRYGQIGLTELLQAITQKWHTERDTLLRSGEQIAGAIASTTVSSQPLPDGHAIAQNAFEDLLYNFDSEYGGFGAAPKFPIPHHLLFLMRCHYLGVGSNALELVEKTLTSMYRGGIYDHIGGGFSRYSTDRQWLAPHFEKMLYDNALLVIALTECYQITGKKLYHGLIEQTLAYIQREMTAPEGGFYSAQDADIDGEEGKYYTFSKAEILDVLGHERGQAFCGHYNVTDNGNFEGANILNLLHQQDTELPGSALQTDLQKLLTYRQSRYKLHKDDKILTSWNGLMIAACAKAYRVLQNGSYLRLASNAYHFVSGHLIESDGTFFVSYRNGIAKGIGLLDDYAFFAWACLELYESTFECEYLERACSVMEQILSRFSRDSGGLYLSPCDGEQLILRPMEQYDGAIPSGNSVAAWCLARLAALTGEAHWQTAAQKQLEAYAESFQSHPTASTFALLALLQQTFSSQELLCSLPSNSKKHSLALAWGKCYHPQTTVLVKSPGQEESLTKLAPYTSAYPVGQQDAFYLCKNFSCSAPVQHLEDVMTLLEQ